MILAGESNFWISLAIMAIWVVSAVLEGKRKKQIQRQKEERQREQFPTASKQVQFPTAHKQEQLPAGFEQERQRDPVQSQQEAGSHRRSIEVDPEDPRSIQEILNDVLWQEHHQEERSEHEGSLREHEQAETEMSGASAEHVFSAEEHVANEGQRSSKLLTPDQINKIRAEEILKLNRESQRPVGHASMQRRLPPKLFSQGIPQAIIATEILQKPRSMRGGNVR